MCLNDNGLLLPIYIASTLGIHDYFYSFKDCLGETLGSLLRAETVVSSSVTCDSVAHGFLPHRIVETAYPRNWKHTHSKG